MFWDYVWDLSVTDNQVVDTCASRPCSPTVPPAVPPPRSRLPPPEVPVDARPVWALPAHALHCGSVEEAAAHCESLLGLESVEHLNLSALDQGRREAAVDTQLELDSAKARHSAAAGILCATMRV